LAGIFKGLGEGWKTAKPLCVGLLNFGPSRYEKHIASFIFIEIQKFDLLIPKALEIPRFTGNLARNTLQ
jgi:hypothetical protein